MMKVPEVGEIYEAYHRAGTPHFISLLDAKIAVIMTGGYRPQDRCQMGSAEFAFSPDGHVFPCERLVGNGAANQHCLGKIGDDVSPCGSCGVSRSTVGNNVECQACGLREYCMRWCGCSNFMATGHYDRVSGFLCASEQAAIKVAFEVFQTLGQDLKARFVQQVVAQQQPLCNQPVSEGTHRRPDPIR
jgi:uncharacterized protein